MPLAPGCSLLAVGAGLRISSCFWHPSPPRALPWQHGFPIGWELGGQPWEGERDLAGRVVSCPSAPACLPGGCELPCPMFGVTPGDGAPVNPLLQHPAPNRHHGEGRQRARLLLRPTASIAGSLVDFLKTSEGVKLSINKLLDMAAQVTGDGAMGLLAGRALPGLPCSGWQLLIAIIPNCRSPKAWPSSRPRTTSTVTCALPTSSCRTPCPAKLPTLGWLVSSRTMSTRLVRVRPPPPQPHTCPH